jgi:hypothetical protein
MERSLVFFSIFIAVLAASGHAARVPLAPGEVPPASIYPAGSPRPPQRFAQQGEYIIVTGGVSLWTWEKWKKAPHDNWWLNFVNAACLRIEEIKAADPGAQITWLVFRPSYVTRSKQDAKDLLGMIAADPATRIADLRWFDRTEPLINYLNIGKPRATTKIVNLEFFVHSNKACFMFDYSNMIDSASKAWMHERDFGRINRGIFAKDAYVRSWGCHTGESMSRAWRAATGIPMWGAVGKTQYMTHTLPELAKAGGSWTR